MRWIVALTACLAVSFGAAAQDIPVTGAPGASISSVINTPTLLTVVLKSGQKIPNLRLVDVNDTTAVFMTDSGSKTPYKRETLKEFVVQSGHVEKVAFTPIKGSSLQPDNQRILDRVWTRVNEIFQGSDENQEIKMRAAAMLALNGDEAAKTYLKQLIESNDMRTRCTAGFHYYVAGLQLPETLLKEGLEHGDRTVRSMASSLAGLAGYQDAKHTLHVLLQDRDDQLSVPAAKGLALLGDRSILPDMYEFLGSSDEKRGEAGIKALEILGGTDVIEDLKAHAKQVKATELYRTMRVLHDLKVPEGKEGLKNVFNEVPTLKPEVALILASDGEFQAQQFLRDRISRRENPTEHNLIYRARNASALYKGGFTQAQSVLQDLLGEDKLSVKNAVFAELTFLGDEQLLKILQGCIEKKEAAVAVGACSAAVAIADKDYRERLLKVKD
jgi:hypothetical protein